MEQLQGWESLTEVPGKFNCNLVAIDQENFIMAQQPEISLCTGTGDSIDVFSYLPLIDQDSNQQENRNDRQQKEIAGG